MPGTVTGVNSSLYPMGNDNSLVHLMPTGVNSSPMGSTVSSNSLALNQQGIPISSWQTASSITQGEIHPNLNIPPSYVAPNDSSNLLGHHHLVIA